MKLRRQGKRELRGVTVPWKGHVVKGRWSRPSVPSLRTSCCVVLLLLAQAARAQETSVEVLHRFNPAPEGAAPYSALVQGADGSLFGTTSSGDANDLGTIFKLDSRGVLTTLLKRSLVSSESGRGQR